MTAGERSRALAEMSDEDLYVMLLDALSVAMQRRYVSTPTAEAVARDLATSGMDVSDEFALGAMAECSAARIELEEAT